LRASFRHPEHPAGKALCVKGLAAPEIIYNEQRQLCPLKRRTPSWPKMV
jgi:anaerobic selenocysteine-containing dehydrogenase